MNESLPLCLDKLNLAKRIQVSGSFLWGGKEKKSGSVGFFHFMLRPLCVTRLLSTVILPSNRSEDSSLGLSRNIKKPSGFESVPELRSLHKLRAVHSLPFLLLTSVYDP